MPIKKITNVNADTGEKSYTLLLVAFFLLSYILPLGARHLAVPDETRYAEIPREMIASGDWVVPHINGVRYFEKPVMGYWIHAVSLLLLGENNFAVRFPSALAVGLTALLIFFLVRRVQRGDTEEKELPAAPLAALIYLSCFEVFGVGNTAVLDNLFAFFVTTTIAFFYLATEERPGSRREKLFLLASGALCGIAFLTKGFLAFALPVLTLAPYLVWQRRYLDLFRLAWLPVLTAIVVILPWAILIHLREPDFWQFFIWNEHFRRFLSDSADHSQPFWLFFLSAAPMFLPWVLMVPASFAGIQTFFRNPGSEGRFIRLSLCWMILPFLFISISEGKLLTYILPCFPPFAMIMSVSLLNVLQKDGKTRLVQWGIGGNAILFTILLITVLYLQIVGFKGFKIYTHLWKVIALAAGIASMIFFYFRALRIRKGPEKLILLGTAPLLLFFAIHFLIPDLTNEVKSPGPLMLRNKQFIDKDDIIITSKDTVMAVCWYFKRDNVHVLGWPGELHYGLGYNDASRRSLDMRSARHLIKRFPGKTVVVAEADELSKWQTNLPKPVFEDRTGPRGYIIRRY